MCSSRQHSKGSLLWQIALALVLLVVYVRTLLPGVGYHPDTAKFQFVGYILGTPHAPGYPTYVVLNHLFTTFFPWGSVAYKANLLSAIFSVCACIVLFRILKLLELRDHLAFVASLAFGFTRTFWSQSVIAEVYSLNALFAALVVYFFLRWNATRKDRSLLMACALYAMSFGNHLTMLTFLPAIFLLVWKTDKSVFLRKKLVVLTSIFVVLGASQYYYPLWRFHDPNTLYLDMQTPTLRKLLYAVTGGHFRPVMFSFSVGEVVSGRIPMFLKLLWQEYSVAIPIILMGVWKLRNPPVRAFLLVSILGNLFFALNYSIPDIFIYFIPTYLVLAVYLGVGLRSLGELIPAQRRIVFSVVVTVLPIFFLLFNYGKVDQHENTTAAEAKDILTTAGQNAVVFGRGKELPRLYFLYYLFGEGLYRNEIYVVKFTPQFVDSYLFQKQRYHYRELRKNVPRGLRVYCTTEGQKSALERLGFGMTKVANRIYRLEKAPAVKRSLSPMEVEESVEESE